MIPLGGNPFSLDEYLYLFLILNLLENNWQRCNSRVSFDRRSNFYIFWKCKIWDGNFAFDCNAGWNWMNVIPASQGRRYTRLCADHLIWGAGSFYARRIYNILYSALYIIFCAIKRKQSMAITALNSCLNFINAPFIKCKFSLYLTPVLK